jgi:hypothetical protein
MLMVTSSGVVFEPLLHRDFESPLGEIVIGHVVHKRMDEENPAARRVQQIPTVQRVRQGGLVKTGSLI